LKIREFAVLDFATNAGAPSSGVGNSSGMKNAPPGPEDGALAYTE
jgi:hypothetical protein